MNRFLYLGDIHKIGEFLDDFMINQTQPSACYHNTFNVVVDEMKKVSSFFGILTSSDKNVTIFIK